MIRTACCLAFLMLLASPLSAQSGFYGGGMVAADVGSRGAFDTLGTFPTAGGFIGVRFHDAWSIEFHLDRGFAESAEREKIEIFGRSTIQDRAGEGRAFLLTWNWRHRSRVGAAVAMGISTRSFSTHRLSITRTIPDDPYPVKLGVASEDGGVGWTGGVLFPIAVGGRWSLAPELRVTPLGVTAESGGYRQFYTGVRVMWGF